jgi:hypothetical protein
MKSNSPLTGDPVTTCRACRTTWTPTRGKWLVKKPSGALSYLTLQQEKDGEPVPLSRCPECGALTAAGKATVEEVTDS